MANTRRRQNEQLDLAIISLRLVAAEGMRFNNLEATVLARNKFVPRTSIIRELLGLDAPDVLTEAEIAYFRTGKKTADELTSNSITYIPLDKKKLSEVQDDETQTTKQRKTG